MSNLYYYRDNVYTTDEEHITDFEEATTEQLDAVLRYFEGLAADRRLEIVYTSVFRPDDDGSPHKEGRAADVRIYHPSRGIQWDSVGCGLDADDARELTDILNETFQWERPTAIMHGDSLNFHIHIQVPARPWR